MSLPYSLLFFFLLFPCLSLSKSTIEPCTGSDFCNAMLGYTLSTDLKVSELSTLFQIDPISVLTANAIDISYPDIENHILPSQLFLKIPIVCSCVDGIRKSVSAHYKVRASDTLPSIASSTYSGLVTADQIREANSITDPQLIDIGQSLVIPLPCTCFNSTDNGFPAIYLSYLVRFGDTLSDIASKYITTMTDLMTVNAMENPSVKAGDILAIPLPACASTFPRFSRDAGLIVANGSYAITASHCVQCSCGPGNLNLYCTPSSLAVSCSSMQCRNSNLMLGNVTAQPTSAGCNVTSCSYNGFFNGTIFTSLFTSFQPRCPGVHQLPLLIPPPTVLAEPPLSPLSSPSPSPSGHATVPKSSSTPVTPSLPGFTPANGPIGSTSDALSSINQSNLFLYALILCLFLKFVA